MKHKFNFFNRCLLLLVAMMTIGVGSVWGGSPISLSNSDFKYTSTSYSEKTVTKDGVNFTMSNGAKNGTSNLAFKTSSTLINTDPIAGNVTNITINGVSYSSSSNAGFEIYVGSTSTAVTTKKYDGAGTGDVSVDISGGSYKYIKIANKSKRALYCSSIVITYSSAITMAFDLNGGTGTKPDTIKSFPATFPSTSGITKTGYDADGWNSKTDGTGTSKAAGTSGYTPTAAETWYVKWVAKTTTVTLSAPDATTAGTTQVTATYGQAMPTNSVTMPQWVGHTFNGFFDAETSGTKYYNANGTSAKNWDKEGATATLHAQWTIQTYNITYKDQGGSSFSGTHVTGYPTSHTYGMATVLDSPTKTGYTFDGWFENSDCSGSAVTTIAGDAKTAAFTLYAKWTANKYNVTFDKNNADAEGTMDPQEFTFKVAANLNKNTFTLAHNTFLGWATTASGSKAYNDEASYTMSTEGATLYAKWATNQTTITLDKQEGSGGTSSVTATYGQNMPTLTYIPSRAGYNFMGYYSETNGQGTKYYNADKSSATTWDSDDKTKTLYAYWEPKTISVTLDKGEHGENNGSATIVYNTKTWDTFSAVAPNTGYTLNGYFTASSNGTKIINADGSLISGVSGYTDSDGNWKKDATNITLYAQYSPINYTITWMANGESWADKGGSANADYGTQVSAVPTTTPAFECGGKVFVGWTKNQNYSHATDAPSDLFNKVSTSPIIEGNTTFYAVFAGEEMSKEPVEQISIVDFDNDNDDWTIDNAITTTANQGTSGTDKAGKISTNNTYITFNDKVKVKEFGFSLKRTSTNANYNVYVETSSDGESWTARQTYAMGDFGNGSYTTKNDNTFDGNTELYVRFHCYNTTATRYVDDVTIKYMAIGLTHVNYATTCLPTLSTPVLNEVSDITASSAQITWGSVEHASGYQYKLGDGEWQTAGNCSQIINGLSAGVEYIVSVRAKGSASYNDSKAASKSFTTLYTITAATNDDTKGTAKISTDGVTEAASIACAAGTKIYLHAHPVSAEYELSTWSTNSGTISSDKSYIEGWTENTTVTATFVAASIPSHNVNWSVNDVVTPESYKEGASITFGTPASIPEGYTFKGWTATPIATSQTTAPEYVTEATMGTADVTYYAVFAKNVSGKQDEQYTFSEFTSSSSVNLDATNYTITLAGGGTNPAWVASASEARLYAGGTMTIAAKNSAVISKVVYTYKVNSSKSGAYPTISSVEGNNSDAGTWNAETKTWETSSKAATSVVMTTTGTAGNLGFTSLTVTVGTEVLTYYTSIRTLQSILISGDVTKKEYFEESVLDPTGLTVKAHYDKGEDVTLTSGVAWTFDPETLSVGNTTCDVTATALEMTSDVKQITGLTVNAIPTYAITANAAEGGSYTLKIGDGEVINVPAEGDAYSSRAEKVITLTSTPASGYKAHSTPFVVKDEDDATVSVIKDGNNYTFTMPAKAVIISAQFVQQFNINTATLEHGSVASIKDNDGNDITATSKGSKVWVVFTPEAGYSISEVTVTKEGTSETVATTVDSENPNRYSFTMPQSNVTVSATFSQINYTITLNNRGNVTLIENKHYNDVYEFEAQTICPEYAFHGWTEEEPTSGTWATAPATVISYTVTASKTFYAVYKEEGDPVLTNNYKIISSADFESGKNYIITNYSGSKEYGLSNAFTAADGNYTYAQFASTEVSVSNDVIVGSASIIWQITGNATDGYKLYNANSSKYIGADFDHDDLGFVDDPSDAIPFTITITDEDGEYSTITFYQDYVGTSGTYKYYYFTRYASDNAFEVCSSDGTNYIYKQQTESGYNYLANPTCKTLESVEVYEYSEHKVNYKAGENFDKTGLGLVAKFSDESSDLILADDIVIEGGTNLQMSATSVTANYTYDGVTKSCDVAINMIELKSIAVNNTSAHKTEYKIGQTFNPAGLKLDATYNTQDGKPQLMPAIVEVVTEGFDYLPKTGLVEGENEITITYNGKETTTTVTAAAAQPYTVTFKVYNDDAATDWETYEVTETAVESGVKVPNVISCYGYEFDGWSKSEMALETSYTKETITDGKYYPDGNTTLYATFSTIDGGESYSKVTDLSTIATGDRVAIIKGFTPWKQMLISGNKVGVTGGGSEPTNPMEYYGQSWVVEKTNGGKYIFRDGTFTIGKSTLENGDLANSTTNSEWSISAYGTDKFTIYQTNSSTKAYMQYYSGSTWTIYNLADANTHVVNYIYKQGGTKKYTTELECNASIDMYEVVLDAGNGTLAKDAFKVLNGESLTLPTPEFSCNDWIFDGWCTTEAKLELSSKPTYVATTYTPTEDIILYSVYKRSESYVAGGKVYKSAPSCNTMVTIAPESGNHAEAKTMTMVAGDGVEHIYYTDNGTYPVDENGAKVDAAKEYTEAISLTDNASIIAYAVYSDGNSDLSFASFTFTKPENPEFNVEAGNVYINSTVTITSATGSNVYYKIGKGDFVNAGTNSYTYTFTSLGDVTITAKTEKGGLYSSEVANAYTVKNVARTIYLNAGKGSFSDGQTKTLVEENYGDGVTLVAPDNLPYANDKWTFFGWAAASVTTTTDKPTVTKAGATYIPTVDGETLYAVYAKVSGMKYLLVEDFNSAPNGNTTSSDGSNSSWTVDGVFDADNCANLYQAGQAIRLGKGNAVGTLTTKSLNNAEGDDIAISFSLKGWPNNTAKISVGITGKEAVTKTTESYDFESKSLQFENVPANAVVTFSTTSDYKRDYLDNLVIATGTKVTRYATNPDQDGAYVRLNGNGARVPFLGVKIGSDEKIVLPEPVLDIEGATFQGWKSGSQTYQAGELISGSTTDVEFAADYQVYLEDEASIVINKPTAISTLVVKAGAKAELKDNLTVDNFIIQSSMGTGKSGQVIGSNKLTITGNGYIDITLGDNANADKWHAFAVPFPVDMINGITNASTGAKLYNEQDYAIMVYQGDVRAQGKYGWIKVPKTGNTILQPGVFYLMTVNGDVPTFRMKMYGSFSPAAKSIAVKEYAQTSGVTTDAGWNGIANSQLDYRSVGAAVQVLDPVSYTYVTKTASSTDFIVGTPFFYQAGQDSTIVLNNITGGEVYAPNRVAATQAKDISVTLANATFADYLYISSTEEATSDYQIGRDLVKMTMTSAPAVPQIFALAYNTKLCMVDVPMAGDEARYNLSLYAPKAGEYTLAAAPVVGYEILLTLNGDVIWNLSKNDYMIDLSNGNNDEYGLILKMAQTPTDINNIRGSEDGIQKFIYDERLVIIREGKVYNAAGALMK